MSGKRKLTTADHRSLAERSALHERDVWLHNILPRLGAGDIRRLKQACQVFNELVAEYAFWQRREEITALTESKGAWTFDAFPGRDGMYDGLVIKCDLDIDNKQAFKERLQVTNREQATKVYGHYFPHVEILTVDIGLIDFEKVRGRRVRVNVCGDQDAERIPTTCPEKIERLEITWRRAGNTRPAGRYQRYSDRPYLWRHRVLMKGHLCANHVWGQATGVRLLDYTYVAWETFPNLREVCVKNMLCGPLTLPAWVTHVRVEENSAGDIVAPGCEYMQVADHTGQIVAPKLKVLVTESKFVRAPHAGCKVILLSRL